MISVIIIAYNVGKYISKCLESIMNQTYTNLEIVIVDDASTDNTGEICREYQNKDGRIKYIRHNTNQGHANARNTGLDNATGEYISFIDSDDYVLLNYYEILYNNLKGTDSDISICDFKYVNENENLKLQDKPNDLSIYEGDAKYYTFFSELRTQFVVSWGKIYKKKIFINLRYVPNSSNEDSNIAHKVIAKAKKIVYTPKELYIYVKREGSIVQSMYNVKRLDVLDGEYDKIIFFEDVINCKKLSNCAKCYFWINLIKNLYYLEKYVPNYKNYKANVIKRYEGVDKVLDVVKRLVNENKEYQEDFGKFVQLNIPLEYFYRVNASQFSDIDLELIKEDSYIMKISYTINKKDKEIGIMRLFFDDDLANWESKEGLEITAKSNTPNTKLKIAITDSNDAIWQGDIYLDINYRIIKLPFSSLQIDETIILNQTKNIDLQRIKCIGYDFDSKLKNQVGNIYLKGVRLY